MLRRTTRILWLAALTLTLVGFGAWGALALWYRAPFGESLRLPGAGAWVCIALAILVALFTRLHRAAVLAFGLSVLALMGWWSTVLPSADRDWTPDVAHTARATIDGETLTVENVRNFTWRSDSDFDERWETRQYDLRKLEGADLFLSYWAGEAIAHAIVSFQFTDAPPLAFSIEIRKEKGEEYSATAGFFKQYELAFIAADERDVVKVRATVRGEDVRLYRIDIQRSTARRLLEMYVINANRAATKPRWYNTFTTNCTTTIFAMARVLDPGIPRDWRVLFSGYLPGYLYDRDFLNRAVSLQDLVAASHIGPRAAGPVDDPGFSARIRQGVPLP